MNNKKNRFTEQAMADISEAFSTMLPIMTDCDKNKPNGIVLEVLQKGYMYKDKVIRPSMVKVNKIDE